MMKSKPGNNRISLRERVTSDKNIFNAIHALPSYIFEEALLKDCDIRLYHKLLDEFDQDLVNSTIKKCRNKINLILDNPNKLFKVSVYFKIKKAEKDTGKVVYRPIHVARLTDLICMASMLQCLMFEDDDCRKPSDLSKKIPNNFYGNKPSTSVDLLFENWQEKYAEYNRNIVDCSNRFRKSHEYKTEVTLDIINFFPSIDPKFIINYCKEALTGRYDQNGPDLDTLQSILEKLVYLQIRKANIKGWMEEYYGKTILSDDLFLARGVAQGLPQSYYFGNICMVEIRNVLKKPGMFKGEEMYYVDDSVIYIKETFSGKNNFYDRIKNLNEEIGSHFKRFMPSIEFKNRNYNDSNPIHKFHNQISYQIEFHKDSKSEYCHIDDTEWNLRGLPRIVSNLGFYMLLDEIDQDIELDKLEALTKYVDNYLILLKFIEARFGNDDEKKDNSDEMEVLFKKLSENDEFKLDFLRNITNKNELKVDELRADKKLLKRYKKLFLYNVKLLKFKKEGKIDTEDLSFKDDFRVGAHPQASEIHRWIDNDDKSRFKAEGRMLIRNLPLKNAREICNEAYTWEKNITNKEDSVSKYLYHQKDFNGTLTMKGIEYDIYGSLKILMKLHYSQLRQTSLENRTKSLLNLIQDIERISREEKPNDNLESYSPIYDILPRYVSYALRNSEEMKRRILNAFFSFISEYEISDSLMLVKANGKPIPYSEMRILTKLRNKRFSVVDFKFFIESLDIRSLENKMAIDYGLTKILGELVRYVSNPIWVDSIIQTHRITKGLWQNGSKFLNSYTLHNEEHAVTLIEKSIDIVKKVNYLALKQVDYFILFLACYLHDISMVIHPNLHDINDGSEKAHLLISQWMMKFKDKFNEYNKEKKNGNKSNRTNTFKEAGLFLKDIFEDFYKYFEDKIRDAHATDSARFVIEKSKSLFDFIDPAMISIIAHIGESHGYDISDVYGLKSKARYDTISEKYLMMIIRLADLHDVANDRINYHLLKQNVWHMNEFSRFHWISHLITDSIRIVPDYSISLRILPNDNKFDIQQYIIENLKFELTINVKCLSPIQQLNGFSRCKGITAIEMKDTEEEHGGCFSVKIGKGVCSKFLCPTICRWTMKKHEWLVKELEALNEYLNSVNQGMIRSKIELNIIFKDELDLEQDLYDDVIKFLEDH